VRSLRYHRFMKRLFALFFLFWLAASPGVRAASQDEDYVRIYNLIQLADSLNETGQTAHALAKYLEAQTALKRFQTVNPIWNAKVINFRLKYLESKITPLATSMSVTNAPPKPATNAVPPAARTEF